MVQLDSMAHRNDIRRCVVGLAYAGSMLAALPPTVEYIHDLPSDHMGPQLESNDAVYRSDSSLHSINARVQLWLQPLSSTGTAF